MKTHKITFLTWGFFFVEGRQFHVQTDHKEGNIVRFMIECGTECHFFLHSGSGEIMGAGDTILSTFKNDKSSAISAALFDPRGRRCRSYGNPQIWSAFWRGAATNPIPLQWIYLWIYKRIYDFIQWVYEFIYEGYIFRVKTVWIMSKVGNDATIGTTYDNISSNSKRIMRHILGACTLR